MIQIYNAFITFLSSGYRALIDTFSEGPSSNPQINKQQLGNIYLKRRFQKMYPQLVRFITQFKNGGKERLGMNGSNNNIGMKGSNIGMKGSNIGSNNDNAHNTRNTHTTHNAHNSTIHGKQSQSTTTQEEDVQYLSRVYQEMFPLINQQFKQANNKQESTIIRSRTVCIQSLRFAVAYLERISTQFDSKFRCASGSLLPHRLYFLSRVRNLKVIQQQFSDVLFTDATPKIIDLSTAAKLYKSLKLTDEQPDIQTYSHQLLTYLRDIFDKIRSITKGEVPATIIQKINSLVWKTFLTYMLKLFAQEQSTLYQNSISSASLSNKANFQKFIDEMYSGVRYKLGLKEEVMQPGYTMIVGTMAILKCEDWHACKQMISSSLSKYQFVYNIILKVMEAAQCMQGISKEQRGERKRQIEEWIEGNLLGNQ